MSVHKFHRVYNDKVIIWNGEEPGDLYPVVEEDIIIPVELLEIAKGWKEKSDATGDTGCCVIGAKMTFKYNGTEYEMKPQSRWQGENSWTPHRHWVKEELEKLGAIDIYYECGMLD